MKKDEKKLEKVKYDLSNFKDIEFDQEPLKEEKRFIPSNLEVSLILIGMSSKLYMIKRQRKK